MKLRIRVILTLIFISTLSWSQNLTEQVDIIDKSIAKIFDSEKPGAVILIAKDGVPIYKKAYGLADYENKIPLNTSHSFAIGSLSKQFTAVAILLLDQYGKLSVDDDITKYFPNVPQFKGISISNLLNHSSGIPDYFKIPEWRNDLTKDLSKEETFNLIKNQELEFVPGETNKYSNSGYHILGMICEIVAKQTLNQFITGNILKPLNMTETGFIDG